MRSSSIAVARNVLKSGPISSDAAGVQVWRKTVVPLTIAQTEENPLFVDWKV